MDMNLIEMDKEIVNKLREKSPLEIAEFLGIEINNSTESVVIQFVSNLIKARQGVGMSASVKQYISKSYTNDDN